METEEKMRMGARVRRRRILTDQFSYKLEKYLTGNQRWSYGLKVDC
jgi:hypothetical protein